MGSGVLGMAFFVHFYGLVFGVGALKRRKNFYEGNLVQKYIMELVIYCFTDNRRVYCMTMLNFSILQHSESLII